MLCVCESLCVGELVGVRRQRWCKKQGNKALGKEILRGGTFKLRVTKK